MIPHYRPIPTTFRKDGFDYKLLCRDGDAAIFESDIGVVEASLDAQIAALEKGFVKMLGSRT